MTHEALEPCPWCNAELVHIESCAKTYDPTRLYHEYHHPDQPCVLAKSWWYFDETMDRRGPFLSLWNTRPPNPLQAEVDALRARVAELEGNNARLREHIAKIANTINIVGSTYDLAIKALESVVTEVKRSSRAALKQEETK